MLEERGGAVGWHYGSFRREFQKLSSLDGGTVGNT